MTVWFAVSLSSAYWSSRSRVVVIFVREQSWAMFKTPSSNLYRISTPLISLIMVARYKEESVGAYTQPCLRPIVIGNGSELFLLSWRIWIRNMKLSGEPYRAKGPHVAGLGFIKSYLKIPDEHQWFLLLTTHLRANSHKSRCRH